METYVGRNQIIQLMTKSPLYLEGLTNYLYEEGGNIMFPRKRKENSYRQKNEEASPEIVYFECNKLGHVKNECPKLRRKHDTSKKSQMATGEDLD